MCHLTTTAYPASGIPKYVLVVLDWPGQLFNSYHCCWLQFNKNPTIFATLMDPRLARLYK